MKKVIIAILAILVIGIGFYYGYQNSQSSNLPILKLKGAFERKPVEIIPPLSNQPNTRVFINLSIEQGTCKVSKKDPNGTLSTLFFMGKGNFTQNLPKGYSLILDPENHTGKYDGYIDTTGNYIVLSQE